MEDQKPAKPFKNNPLGQETPSEKVGGGETPNMEHNQSADLVEEVKKRAEKQHETQKDDQPHQKTQYESEKTPWP